MNTMATQGLAATLEIKLRGERSESKACSSAAEENSILTQSPTEHMTQIGLIILCIQRLIER